MFHLDEKWARRFMGQSLVNATYSKDPSTKVGCVIANTDNQIIGQGYNGFSRKSPDHKECLEHRSKKYPRTIHAEENAIFNASSGVKGCIAYVSHPPCVPCLNKLSQVGIDHVVSFEPHPDFADRWNLDEVQDEACDLGMVLFLFTPEQKVSIYEDMVASLQKLI